jgi:hypothetical protein
MTPGRAPGRAHDASPERLFCAGGQIAQIRPVGAWLEGSKSPRPTRRTPMTPRMGVDRTFLRLIRAGMAPDSARSVLRAVPRAPRDASCPSGQNVGRRRHRRGQRSHRGRFGAIVGRPSGPSRRLGAIVGRPSGPSRPAWASWPTGQWRPSRPAPRPPRPRHGPPPVSPRGPRTRRAPPLPAGPRRGR